MAFFRQAGVQVLSVATSDGKDFKKSAAYNGKSAYFDGATKIDVQAALDLVASEYNISSDPKDYIFEAIRGNTSNVRNENKDAFHKTELLRFDHRLGKQVFRTYQYKPHQIQHRADNPKTARGFILDATYNDKSPASAECENCHAKTAAKEARDAETGLHCLKCGHVVKDEFVELLVAIDTKKDPVFANGVMSGVLRHGSMGCSCARTRCNVCNHVASTATEFCKHIRNKGKVYAEGSDDFNPVAYTVKYTSVDDANGRTASSMKEAEAFEWCEGVVFEEYSRVQDPADPKAEQYEILKLSASMKEATNNTLAQESELLILKSKVAMLEKSMSKAAQIQDKPILCPECAEGKMARWEDADPMHDGDNYTRCEGCAELTPAASEVEGHKSADVIVNIGDGTDDVDIQSQDPIEDEQGTSIDDLTPADVGLTPAEEGEQLTPAAMGIMTNSPSKGVSTPPKRGGSKELSQFEVAVSLSKLGAFICGGAPRDFYLGKEPRDIDCFVQPGVTNKVTRFLIKNGFKRVRRTFEKGSCVIDLVNTKKTSAKDIVTGFDCDVCKWWVTPSGKLAALSNDVKNATKNRVASFDESLDLFKTSKKRADKMQKLGWKTVMKKLAWSDIKQGDETYDGYDLVERMDISDSEGNPHFITIESRYGNTDAWLDDTMQLVPEMNNKNLDKVRQKAEGYVNKIKSMSASDWASAMDAFDDADAGNTNNTNFGAVIDNVSDSLHTNKETPAAACECGGDKTNTPHSSWCPKFKGASVYKELSISTTKSGNLAVSDASGTLFVMPVDPKSKSATNDDILKAIQADGLTTTMQKHKAVPSLRLAQVLDKAIDDMLNEDRQETNSTHEERDETMTDPRPDGELLDSATESGEHTDTEEHHEEKDLKDDVLEGREVDVEDEKHDKDPHSLNVTKDRDFDMREKRKDFDMGDSALDGEAHDHQGKVAAVEHEKHIARLTKLYDTRLAEQAAAFTSKHKADMDMLQNRLVRALKFVARRQAMNIEHSPLKEAFGIVLANGRDLGQGYEYVPMDQSTAVSLIETAFGDKVASSKPTWEAFLDGLFERAASVMQMSDEALMQVETDMNNIRTASVVIDHYQEPTHDENVRQAARAGNFQVAPVDNGDDTPRESRAASIREAIGGMKVGNLAQNTKGMKF